MSLYDELHETGNYENLSSAASPSSDVYIYSDDGFEIPVSEPPFINDNNLIIIYRMRRFLLSSLHTEPMTDSMKSWMWRQKTAEKQNSVGGISL